VTKRRLQAALVCYGALALVAASVLSDRRFLAAVLVLLAGVAVMSITAYLRERCDRDD